VLKNSWRGLQSPSAAKAVVEDKPVIAAVNRCATQNQVQDRLFQRPVKPQCLCAPGGAAGSRALSKPIYEMASQPFPDKSGRAAVE